MGCRTASRSSPGSAATGRASGGLRMTVSDVLEYLESGMSEDEVLHDSPDLTRGDIRVCLVNRRRSPVAARCRSQVNVFGRLAVVVS